MKLSLLPPSPCIRAFAALCLVFSLPAQDSPPPSIPSKVVDVKERQLAESATAKLRAKWVDHIKSSPARESVRPPMVVRPLGFFAPDEQAMLPAPQRQALALATASPYVEPEVFSSKDGLLEVKLEAVYAHNRIGGDPVYLRSINGRLVGPTLRVKRGDKVRITLKNSLPPERWLPNMMNTLNSFNTLNMHYHGLHVSPNGISDNVLIQIGPEETQIYELDIPKNHTTGTYWYHPHRHGSTAGTVASGMSGALIVEGGLDDVPAIKAATDRVMVLNQIPYIYKNEFTDNSTTPPTVTKFDLKEGLIEVKYANFIFGPGDWNKMGRYTTINGVQLPVIRMAPGQVERWRFIDSGQREMIMLKIVPAPNQGEANPAAPIPFHEIAVDGLALGKIVTTPSIELWPGYRSDVLVQAPETPGEYLLIDDAVPAASTLGGENKPLNYVARIVVEGAPRKMALPSNAEIARLNLRIPSVKDGELTGSQKASYGILLVGNGVVFTIDGKSFDMETARELKLNDVEEWTITSLNDVGLVTHPFHIHVNPFEVTSILAPALDAAGNVIPASSSVDRNGNIVTSPKPKLVEQLTGGPVWRDTVKIPGGGQVTMRTRYQDFIGTFVQHCHILDHEDQGMMQLIDIVEKPAPKPANAPRVPGMGSLAPDFTLPDANGRMHSLRGKECQPTVVFFFKGHGCLHCVQQVAAFATHHEAFARQGVRVIGVTSDGVATLKAALEDAAVPFTILADPEGTAFKKFGCVDEKGLRHGTFSLDSRSQVTWRTVDSSPFLAVRELLPSSPNPEASETGKSKNAGLVPVLGNPPVDVPAKPTASVAREALAVPALAPRRAGESLNP